MSKLTPEEWAKRGRKRVETEGLLIPPSEHFGSALNALHEYQRTGEVPKNGLGSVPYVLPGKQEESDTSPGVDSNKIVSFFRFNK